MSDDSSSARIARLNDEFRVNAGLTSHRIPGRCVVTAGIAALDPQTQTEILSRVRTFSVFQPGNDPYGEHDFGAVSTATGEQVYWKIDYFADAAMEYGAEHPDDPHRSFRLLTVMLAAEY